MSINLLLIILSADRKIVTIETKATLVKNFDHA